MSKDARENVVRDAIDNYGRPSTMDELMSLLLIIFPEAIFGEDEISGEIVIHTGVFDGQPLRYHKEKV